MLVVEETRSFQFFQRPFHETQHRTHKLIFPNSSASSVPMRSMAICNQCLPKNVALAELTYKVAKLGSRRPNRTSVLLVGVKLMGLCGPENLKHPKTNMFKVATVFTPANFLSKSDPTVILFWFIELATDAIITWRRQNPCTFCTR